MADRWPHTGAILAGGASRRMRRDKARLTLAGGGTMIEAVAGALGVVCAGIVIVGGGGGGAALPASRRLEDLRPGLGPLGGIEALLASGIDTEYLVCPCDLPRVSAEVLTALTRATERPATVLRVSGEERPRPLPARLSTVALAAVRAKIDEGRLAVNALMDVLGPEVVEAPAAWEAALTNVNTPEEYDGLTPPPRPPRS
jgi:molybdopterin-guanine dinucleotide biosynthesis protein A